MTEEKKESKPLNIYQRVHAVMMDVGYVQKGDKQVNNQYRYVSHDGVVAAVRPMLLKHGVVMVSRIVEKTLELQEMTETVMIYDKSLGSKVPQMHDGKPVLKTTMGYVCTIFMEFDFINIDQPQEKITAQGFGMGIDPQDKATGKAMSYAKKYALLNALLLETGDDPEKDVDYSIGETKPINQKLIWKTAKERKDAFNVLMAELDNTENLTSLKELWEAKGQLLAAFKTSDMQVYLELEKRKDQIKTQFQQMESK